MERGSMDITGSELSERGTGAYLYRLRNRIDSIVMESKVERDLAYLFTGVVPAEQTRVCTVASAVRDNIYKKIMELEQR